MNIQFHRDMEVPAVYDYEIYFNGQHVGRINQYASEYSVSLKLGTKNWSAHIHPTLEAAQNFVRDIIKDNN